MTNTWFYKADKRKITHSAVGCEIEIDFDKKGSKKGEKAMNHKKKDLEVE